jgi:hypothetical protein
VAKVKKKRGKQDSSNAKGRFAIAVVCVLTACYLLWIAHELDTDPTAEARFAATHSGEGSPFTRRAIPFLRNFSLILFGIAGVLVLLGRSEE